MKHIVNKVLCLFGALLIACGLFLSAGTVPTAQAASSAGSFYLFATISTKPVIEPVKVSYKSGQTIKEALKASKYEFGGIDQGYITDIQDIAGNYNIYYDKGGYDLEHLASSITGILFTEREDIGSAELSLVKTMYTYLHKTNHVQEYEPAKAAYEEALEALRTYGSDASSIQKSLKKAMSDYEALFEGTKYTVTLKATQGTKSLSKPHFSLTDAYGNVYETDGTSLSVIKGTYTFVVTDGGMNSTEGTIDITGKSTLTVTLPDGKWFKELNVLNSNRDKYKSSVKLDTGKATFYIPDTATKSDAILNAYMGDVPDPDNTKLYASYYNRYYDKDGSGTKNWESTAASMTGLVLEDCKDADFEISARYTGEDGYLQKQTILCTAKRVPTLTKLTITADGTKLPIDFNPLTKSYKVPTVTKTLKITATGHNKKYTIDGTGTFKITSDENGNVCKIKVTGTNKYSNTYTLTFEKKSSVSVTVNTPSGCTAEVYNKADAKISPSDGVYKLIPGSEYYYVSTKSSEYHVKERFTASKNLNVTAKTPETGVVLTNLALYNDQNAESRVAFTADSSFSSGVHDYIYTIPDIWSAAYGQATCAEGYTATMYYSTQSTNALLHNEETSSEIASPVDKKEDADNIPSILAKCGYAQEALLRVSKDVNGVVYYQDYRLAFHRSLHLSKLSASDVNGELTLYDKNGNEQEFDRNVLTYYASVDRATSEIYINGSFMNEADTSDICGGYYAKVNGTKFETLSDITIALDDTKDQETVTIQVYHKDKNSVSSTYKVYVKKMDPVSVTFKTTPTDANVYIVNKVTNRHVAKKNGVYPLTPGVDYTYTVTRNGYVGKSVESYIAPGSAATVNVSLSQASKNTSLESYDAKWPSFRADQYNNGVVSVKTPDTAEKSTLYWATQLGEGYSADACGCPIIVDGYLYTYAETHLYKVDSVSGEVVAVGEMDHKSSFAINSPTYADGMVFVGLADGTVQAFNASTMESLWIYHDPLKGQPNCPIAYYNGYIYTGFWLGERSPANFVCLSVTDEDPYNTLEEKVPTWRYRHNGYYWAGAYTCKNFVLIGTDDGDTGYLSGHASILSIDPLTGDLIDEYVLKETGDQRSSITFVPDAKGSCSGYGYFTTKGGYFYRIRVNNDGTFTSKGVKKLKLYNYANDDTAPPMSTCTPTIYNGRAYVGVSGTSQFGAYSGHNITVIDLEHWDIAYTVRTQGYPQTSGLLTTAYEKSTDDVYVYFFDNYTPGKLRMLKDHKGQTKPSTTVVEEYVDKGTTKKYDTAYVLFTPDGDQAQYAICSPIVDEYGTIYFKNDSAYLMALGSSIKKLTITEEPDRMDYEVGDVFDGTGMKVTATYQNGKKRDVTAYVTWSDEPLTSDDTEFAIEFPYTMYHDSKGKVGVAVEHPYVNLSINLKTVEEGDPAFKWTKTSGDSTDIDYIDYTCKAVFLEANTGKELSYDCTVKKSIEKKATCEAKGKIIFTASIEYEGKVYEEVKTVSVPAMGHELISEAGKDATCKEEGYLPYEYCTRCDYTTYEVIPGGHEWDEGVITKDATEEEAGTILYTCLRCGKTNEIKFGTPEVHEHSSVKVAAVKATWAKAGKTAGTKCSDCGKILSGCKTVPKAGSPTLSKKSYAYDGEAKKPTVTIKVKKDGETVKLKKGTDYTLSYKNNVKVGKASVTVKLKGNYSGSKTLNFTINPKATSITSVSAVSKGFNVEWKKIAAQADGYQIRYSINSDMKNAKSVKVTSVNTLKKKITKLSSNKKYYVQVRTYKKVDKTTYYSAWSKTQSVKTKK